MEWIEGEYVDGKGKLGKSSGSWNEVEGREMVEIRSGKWIWVSEGEIF